MFVILKQDYLTTTYRNSTEIYRWNTVHVRVRVCVCGARVCACGACVCVCGACAWHCVFVFKITYKNASMQVTILLNIANH